MVERKPENQYWARKATPIGLAINTVMNLGGFALLIWLATHCVDSFEKKIDHLDTKMDEAAKDTDEKTRSFYQRINDLRNKETADILCLTKGLYKCCGNKADVVC